MLMLASGNLKNDPLDFVEQLDSPIGIYLRKEIFERELERDVALRRRLFQRIVSNQSQDGSWRQIFRHTADNLWNLFLLGRDISDFHVRRGLDWILTTQRYQYKGYPGFFLSSKEEAGETSSETHSMQYGLFGPGCRIFYQTAYAIYLFHIFDSDRNQRVQTGVKSFLDFWRPDWCGAWCTINVFRVLAIHSLSSNSKIVEEAVRYLRTKQVERGSWKGYPFYHTFHALSRANMNGARKQIQKALRLICKRQRKDGGWGKKERGVDTFLVLDGLRNIHCI